MENSEIIQFGKTGINRQAAKEMGEDAFKKAFRGKLDHDLDDAWKLINADEGKIISMTPTDGHIDTSKRKNKGKNNSTESESKESL